MAQPAILIVDDEPFLRSTVTRALRRVCPDAAVDVAASSDEATTAIEQRSYRLLITDHYLDGATGTQLAAHAKARWPELSVLLLSGALLDIEPEARAGADAVMAKPFELTDLLQTVQRLLNN
jgi:two-component system, cell cycle response regulator CpdR